MNTSRTSNTIRNSTVGVISHIIVALLSFINRTVFIKVLGVEYLGISGLFSNILTMLALSDLGIYTVMLYSLYGPIAKKDEGQIAAYIRYFQKIYNIVAATVGVIGVLLIPVLPYLVNGSQLTYSELIKYYVLLLANSVSSYLVISRSTLLRADQKVYIVRIVSTLSTILMYLVQIVLLLLFHNYTLYLVCQVSFTLVSNITVSCISTKLYPYLTEKTVCRLDAEIQKNIINNLKSTFIYKIGGSIMNSTDNILISVLVGTAMVGYYSNYVTIFSLVNTFITLIIEGLLASIGNYYATESKSKKYSLFRLLILGFYIIAAFCASCYLAGMNDFISIWVGRDFVISNSFVIALALNRFVFCLIHPIWITRESSGMFVKTKYVTVSAAIINIVLSVLLGKVLGITGIILATAISYLSTVFWYEPNRFVNEYFEADLGLYWKYIAKVLIPMFVPLGIGIVLMQYTTTNFAILFVKFVICGVSTIGTVIVFLGRTIEYNTLKNKLLAILKRKR